MTNTANPINPLPQIFPQNLATPAKTAPLEQLERVGATGDALSRNRQSRRFRNQEADSAQAAKSTWFDTSGERQEVSLPRLDLTTAEDVSQQLSRMLEAKANQSATETSPENEPRLELLLLLNTIPPARARIAVQYEAENSSATPAEAVWSLAFDLQTPALGLIQIRLMFLQQLLTGTLTFSDEDLAAQLREQSEELVRRLMPHGLSERPVLRIRSRPAEEFVPVSEAAAAATPGNWRQLAATPGLRILSELVLFLFHLRPET